MITFALLFVAAAWEPLPGEADFTSGANAQRAGNYAEAAGSFARCEKNDADLAPYAAVHRAQCLARQGQTQEALALFAETAAKDGPWQALAETAWAQECVRANERTEAARHFAPVLALTPRPWWMEDAAWDAADNLLKTGADTGRDKGLDWFRDLAATTVWIQKRKDVAALLKDSPRSEDRLAALDALLRSSAYGDVPALLATAPEDSGAREIAWNPKATSEERLTNAQRLSDAHPDSPWLTQALVYAMRMAAGQKQYDEAQTLIQLVAKRTPGAKTAGDLLWWLAQLTARVHQDARALTCYTELAKQFPDHDRACAALCAAGALLEAAKRPQEALERYLEAGKRFPDHALAPEAWYRAARLQTVKKKSGPEKQYLTNATEHGLGNYYGHLAMQRLNAAEGKPATEVDLRIDGTQSLLQPMPGKRLSATAAVGDPTIALRRVLFFGRNGLEDGAWEALYVLQHLDAAPDKEAAYRVLEEAGFSYMAMQFYLARNKGQTAEAGDETRMRLYYPLAFWNEVRAVALEMGLDPFLILSVARQESTFRATIVSHAGAVGLMQVMPSTARWLAEKDSRIGGEDSANLTVPRNSLRLGAVYLRTMIEQAQGNLGFALAAYNAGPGNVGKWRAARPNATFEAFVEAIPLDETRDYVKRVLGNYAAYHSLYKADREKNVQGL